MAVNMSKPVVYLLSVLGSLVVLLTLWTGLFAYQLGMPTRQSYWTHALVSEKLAAAKAIVDPKMVFVAGSSGNFNIDAEAITKQTNFRSVNLGTHAILTLEYMLDHTKEVLKPGDTVVLALEYLYFAADDRLNEAYIGYLLSRDPEYFKNLPIAEKVDMLTYVSLKRLLTPIKESFYPAEPLYAFNVYSNFFYSPYGDMHSNNLVFLNAEMRAGREAAPAQPLILTNTQADNWALIKAFAAWCKERNIEVLAAPPATLRFDQYNQPEYHAALAKLKGLYGAAGIDFIGDPYEVMYDIDYFFDTNYHTNQRGKNAYTERLIQWLKPHIKAPQTYSPVTVEPTPVDVALRNFNGWMPLSGLRPLDGPFPAANLPLVAWGASQTKLQIETGKSGTAFLKLEFNANLEQHPISILVDDTLVYSKTIIKSPNYITIDISFPVNAGTHVITINSSNETTTESLLYRTILFTAPGSTLLTQERLQ